LKVRIGILLLTATFAASACGSRESGPPLEAVDGAVAASPTTANPNAGRAAMVGTLQPGCSSAAPARGATDKGVTDTTIKIGVISDKSGVVAVPTAGIDGSVDAFVR
jgi:hypothetical protein